MYSFGVTMNDLPKEMHAPRSMCIQYAFDSWTLSVIVYGAGDSVFQSLKLTKLPFIYDSIGQSVNLTIAVFTAGVAYVKYDRASSAALAIENLHEVTLNDGQGPRLKVLLAESPHTR